MTAAGPSADRPPADRRLDEARAALVSVGAHVMPAAVTAACLDVSGTQWANFGRHWNSLCVDSYAAERGACRLRRYGRFEFTAPTGPMRLLPQESFVQPDDSNPLYIDVDRTFEPLTDSFVADPMLRAVLRLLGQSATALDTPASWLVKVHPFRVVASADGQGQPTPEGLHWDGVTLVSSLLVSRRNATGGQSSVFDSAGRPLLTTTLSEPGTLLLGDDRRTLHSVSPIRPSDPSHPAYRDVLVVTFAPG